MGLEQKIITSGVLGSNYPINGVCFVWSEPQVEISRCVRVWARSFTVLIFTHNISLSESKIGMSKICAIKNIVCVCVWVCECVCVSVCLSVCLFVWNILDTSLIPWQPECLVFSWTQAVVITSLNCTVIVSEEHLLIAASTNDNRPIDRIITKIKSLTALGVVLSYNQFWICKF